MIDQLIDHNGENTLFFWLWEAALIAAVLLLLSTTLIPNFSTNHTVGFVGVEGGAF